MLKMPADEDIRRANMEVIKEVVQAIAGGVALAAVLMLFGMSALAVMVITSKDEE